MTLVVTFATPIYVIQVSDRLVTQRFQRGSRTSTEAFDVYANKAVLYAARDAFVAFGYSGPAYIEGLTTDRWIAQLLHGEPVAPLGEIIGMKFGPAPQHLDIGQSLELVRSQLEILFQTRPASYSPKLPLTVAVGGWKWHKAETQMWPFFAKIVVDRTTPVTYRTITSARYWGWEANKYAFDAIGSSAEQAKRAIRTKLATITRLYANECEDLLIEVIREASQNDESVGKDCMSVVMLPKEDPFVVIRYQPELPTLGELTVRNKAHKVPLAFWPWVVLPRLLIPPQVQTGGLPHIPLGSSRIQFESPPLEALGITAPLFSTRTQQRPQDPKHRQP
jgi:hypothetical protein